MTTPTNETEQSAVEFDYIVVGSGAGGGPLAARLALAGCRVLVIEAGSDFSNQPATASPREVTEVPALHPVATEHPDLSWQFFVKHYDNPPTGSDPKELTGEGIFYPRAAALGGCTAHNAMITIAGPDSDWDDLADFIDDDSWRGEVMRSYFQRLEGNEYLDPPRPPPTSYWGRFWDNIRWLFGFRPDYTAGRHGFSGWLRTSWADVALGIHDWQLVSMLKAAFKQVAHDGIERFGAITSHFLHGTGKPALDPNHSNRQADNPAGLALIPLAVCGQDNPIDSSIPPEMPQRGRRFGPREFLLKTKAEHPQNLVIWTECFVTKVLFKEDSTGSEAPRAIGVAYCKGSRLYEAHPGRRNTPGPEDEVLASREVILCGGAFNTPQILMLSGIGERQHLAEHGIKCIADLPGVGRNLHDRYEVTVLSRMRGNFSVVEGATFQLPTDPDNADQVLNNWRTTGTGLYTSNGAIIGILKRSRSDLAQPDLFIFGIPLPFQGYEVGYSDVHKKYPNEQFRRLFTWAILKAHTRNRDGTVRLRSSDPFRRPEINFHYFHEVSAPNGSADDPDLKALADGVKFVRRIAQRTKFVESEFYPGKEVATEEQVSEWIRREAWGHHACGTCRMGPDRDEGAVLDSRFRVRKVEGLRVVDASIFPKIPGYFIVTNIYVASEKAADTILEDARYGGSDPSVYPRELRAVEAEALNERRDKLGRVAESQQAPLQKIGGSGAWPADVTGLALSGGGIRSATFNLGILQAFARSHVLRRIDFLSTVSGGGYIGSFLGRFYDRLRHSPLSATARTGAQPAPDRVERELTSPDSPEIAWLRKHANYIAPTGKGDVRSDLAVFLRNLISVHFVVGAIVLAFFGIANAIRYGLFDPATAGLGFVALGKSNLPLGHLLQDGLGVFWSPWFVVFELILLFMVIPRVIGYWMASQDDNERYQGPALSLVFVLMAVLFFLGLHDGVNGPPLFLAFSLVAAFVAVELAWRRGRRHEESVGSGGVETQRLRTRNYLTEDLGFALAMAGAALAFTLLDTAGHALQQSLVERNKSYTMAFARFGAVLAALVPIARMAANLFVSKKPAGPPSTLGRIFKKEVMAGLLALVLFSVPLIFYSFASHAVYQGGSAILIGISATLLAVVISGILATPRALTFVNRSSLAQTYAARLARAYLGASNPLRHHPTNANITEVVPGDDVPSIRKYRPHEAGGPLHLINVTVNQTLDFASHRANRDRKGENLAVTCFGMSIGQRWHSLWADVSGKGATRTSRKRARLEPIGHKPGTSHPLLEETGVPTNYAETLSLRQWVGISGAALGPGRGQTTRLGTALLFGLANVRTGYWWDSGISEAARDGFPRLTFIQRLLYLIARLLLTQSLLIFEWIARYPGPWERFWYISDGGFFEDLGGYELIRRRVPRMIICDGGADPTYQFDDLANLVRKVRIDFHASVEAFTPEELKKVGVPDNIQDMLGTLEELKPTTDTAGNIVELSKKYASLFWVHYKTEPKRSSVLLYIKAKLTGSETADVRNYCALHPEFPHESTADQIFNEPQWESYRQLGEHLASRLLTDPGWFWAIPIN